MSYLSFHCIRMDVFVWDEKVKKLADVCEPEGETWWMIVARIADGHHLQHPRHLHQDLRQLHRPHLRDDLGSVQGAGSKSEQKFVQIIKLNNIFISPCCHVENKFESLKESLKDVRVGSRFVMMAARRSSSVSSVNSKTAGNISSWIKQCKSISLSGFQNQNNDILRLPTG